LGAFLALTLAALLGVEGTPASAQAPTPTPSSAPGAWEAARTSLLAQPQGPECRAIAGIPSGESRDIWDTAVAAIGSGRSLAYVFSLINQVEVLLGSARQVSRAGFDQPYSLNEAIHCLETALVLFRAIQSPHLIGFVKQSDIDGIQNALEENRRELAEAEEAARLELEAGLAREKAATEDETRPMLLSLEQLREARELVGSAHAGYSEIVGDPDKAQRTRDQLLRIEARIAQLGEAVQKTRTEADAFLGRAGALYDGEGKLVPLQVKLGPYQRALRLLEEARKRYQRLGPGQDSEVQEQLDRARLLRSRLSAAIVDEQRLIRTYILAGVGLLIAALVALSLLRLLKMNDSGREQELERILFPGRRT